MVAQDTAEHFDVLTPARLLEPYHCTAPLSKRPWQRETGAGRTLHQIANE